MFAPGDLILYDALSHNSIQQGIKLSGARAFPFPHNNVRALESLLARHHSGGKRILIVTEGVFSTDGDIAPIPELVRIKREHGAFLLVDEAHSMGVLGATGRGVVEHFGLKADDVDLWMGTLSKSFASCGGYIAGKREVVESLRLAAPGFVYSCGMTPPDAAAATMAARLIRQEPQRVHRLQENARLFKRLAEAAGLDTGDSGASGIVPVILGSSMVSFAVSHLLFERGVLVHFLSYPVVPESASRLRFFLTCLHRTEEIEQTVILLAKAVQDTHELLQQLPLRMTE
jgi:7-keto-8-aminopelargonate synthetase-like enzyme